MVAIESMQAEVGRQLPGGRFIVEPYEDWLLRDVLLESPQRSSVAHPLWAFVGLQRAMGVTVEELFAICKASSEDGPMLGETSIELLSPLRVGVAYQVTARISDVQRKTGARVGLFDIVWVDMEATDDRGRTAARLRNSYVFPRREGTPS